MKMKEKIKRFFRKHFDKIVTYLNTIITLLLSIFANVLYSFFTINGIEINKGLMIGFLLLVLFFVVGNLEEFFEKLKQKLFPNLIENKYVQQAYVAITHLSYKQQQLLQDVFHDCYNYNCALAYHLRNINLIVEQCYDFMVTAYTSKNELINDINFEVTFMTESYDDCEITIPASCNKERRTPTSMLERKTKKDIYKKTVTYEIYEDYRKNLKPTTRIIETTANGSCEKNNYEFLYKGQENRIKSSVVLPIMSHKNELLGTLVVHCDKECFFLKSRWKFWQELLNIFSVEIGKEKFVIDSIVRTKNNLKNPF